MTNPNQLSNKIILFAVGVLISFAVLEIGARIYIENFASYNKFKKYASYKQIAKRIPKFRYSPHKYLGYYPTPNFTRGLDRHNALGYRGEKIAIPKPTGVYRIACLGGSTSYTESVKNHTLSYPSLLEKELVERGYRNVEVVNAGSSGWTSWETMINYMIRVSDLEPDMIIIYHAINDIHARIVWPPGAYKSDNSGSWSYSDSASNKYGILEQSTLARMVLIHFGFIQSDADLQNRYNFSKNNHSRKFINQKQKGVYPKGIFTKVSAMEMLNTNKPIYFERNITNIISSAKQQGVTTILATFATSPLFTDEPAVSSDEYISAYKEMNGTVQRIAAEQDVELFDFNKIFPKDKKYYTDGRHVNEVGSRLKAKLFADFIISNNLIPDKYRTGENK